MLATRFLSLVALSLLAACARHPLPQPTVARESLRSDVLYLASDALQGRMTGSAGEKLAAHYIEQRMRGLGLEPAFGTSFRQSFIFNAGSKALPGSSILVDAMPADIEPLTFSRNGIATGALCYIAYGIVGAGRDDYAGVDVSGAVVVVDRHMHDGMNADERRELAPFLSPRHRAWLAERGGAAGILFVSDEKYGNKTRAISRGKQTGIVAARIDRDALERMSKPTAELTPRAEHAHADARCVSPSARLDVKLTSEQGHGQNVAGLLRATVAEPAGTIVVGAHYDHLGLGEIGSLKENATGVVHNGADDNASGTAAVLALARIASQFEKRSYDIAFVAFSGEEIGLVGSTEFAEKWNTSENGRTMSAMMNFDMIGRLEDTLIVQGVASSPDWPKMLKRSKRSAGVRFDMRMTESAYLPTDAMSFYLEKIPVVNFFSGAHTEYHKPDDDEAFINYDGMAGIIAVAANLLERLATSPPLQYAQAVATERKTGPGMLQVYLGTIPDYSGKESPGLKLAGVRGESPAAAGGLMADDVILRINNTEISDVYTYTYFLSGVAPGEELTVVIERDGTERTLVVIPEGR